MSEYGSELSKLPVVPVKEIAPYIARAKCGDHDAINVVLGSSRARMFKIIRNSYFAHGAIDMEDLVSAGVRGVLEAIKQFDPKRGSWVVALDIYVRKCLSELVRTYTQKWKRTRVLEDVHGVCIDPATVMLDFPELQRRLEKLAPLERQIIEERYAGKSIMEIARKFNRSRLWVRHAECAALRKLSLT